MTESITNTNPLLVRRISECAETDHYQPRLVWDRHIQRFRLVDPKNVKDPLVRAAILITLVERAGKGSK